jgi:hypothetical protein
MKDNAAWACLLLCCLPLGAASAASLTIQFGTPTTKPELMPEPHSDVLEFVDGSALHGKLTGMDLNHGLTWTNSEARNPIHFRPAHLDFVRFAGAQSVNLTPTCHLWFGNGDDLYGWIMSLDNEQVGFKTWFGGAMVIPRKAVRAITFLSTNYSVVYEGPYHEGGWVVANGAPRSWTFHDGAFIGAGPGTLGRELNLTNSTTVEFDLAWNGPFTLETDIYCDVTAGLENNTGSCVVDLNPRQISLRQPWTQGPTFNLAGQPEPESEGKGRMHVAIECDKTAKTVSIFVNHVFAKTWKNCSFGRGGTGFLFSQPNTLNMLGMMAGATFKLSHLKISQWEGRCEPETAAIATNIDAIHFINHDRAFGTVESIQEGKARLVLAGTVLDIPLGRVTQVEFAGAEASAEPSGPWQVRAHFPGGGSLSFQLDKWDDKEVSGRSAIFGSLALEPGAIREMEFNLDRPKENGKDADNKEFEELDE